MKKSIFILGLIGISFYTAVACYGAERNPALEDAFENINTGQPLFPTEVGALFKEANRIYKEAQEVPSPEERNTKYQEAATLFQHVSNQPHTQAWEVGSARSILISMEEDGHWTTDKTTLSNLMLDSAKDYVTLLAKDHPEHARIFKDRLNDIQAIDDPLERIKHIERTNNDMSYNFNPNQP